MTGSLTNFKLDNRNLSNPLWLLIALFFVIALPLLNVIFGSLTIYILPVAYTLLVLFGMLAVSTSSRTFLVGLVLGISLMIVLWLNYSSGSSRWSVLLQSYLSLAFFALLLVFLGRNVLMSPKVTLPVVYGVASGYVLIAAIFSIFFTILENAVPGSLSAGGPEVSDFDYLYFSFVTITTLGYGDMIPVNEAAKSLVIICAVCGQLYLALVVAVIVGKYLTNLRFQDHQ